MEEGKVLVKVEQSGDSLFIGDEPKLVVNLRTQQNYIETKGRRLAYHRKVQFSQDLLEGKRAQVFCTAVKEYYRQACAAAEGAEKAEQYRLKANTTIRER